MEISVSVPLDEGFLRRECPSCQRQFKWHDGSTEGRPEDAIDPLVYFCPYCGEPAETDQWWTQEQIEFVTQSAAGPIMEMAEDELSRATNLKVTTTAGAPPPPLVEASDMVEVESPCHEWEPVKIASDWSDPLHCLVCGSRFAV